MAASYGGLALGASAAQATGWSGPTQVVTFGQSLDSVSCASSSFCAAVSNPAAIFSNGSWSPSPSLGSSTQGLVGISCPTVGFCNLATTTGSVAYSNGAWGTPVAAHVNGQITSMSCWSSTNCLAADESGDSYSFNGSAWSGPTTFDSALSSGGVFSVGSPVLACSASQCAAIDYSGRAFSYNGGVWGTAYDSGDPSTLSNGAGNSVTCAPSGGFCMVLGSNGHISIDQNGKWSQGTTLAFGQADGETQAQGVSCAASNFCVAVGSVSNELPRTLSAYTYNGTTWSGPVTIASSTAALTSVSCASTTFCIAVDDVGQAFTFTGSAATGGGSSGTTNSSSATVRVDRITHATDALSVSLSCAQKTTCAAAAVTARVPRGRRGTITVAQRTVTVKPGQTVTLNIPLTAAGTKLLIHDRHLLASVTVSSGNQTLAKAEVKLVAAARR